MIPYSPDLIKARFINRPNRFIIKCELTETKEVVEAHLADSGRLLELLLPGKMVFLRAVDDPKRKTKYSAVIVERENGMGWVSLNAMLPNQLAVIAVKEGMISKLKDWTYVRSEYKKGSSRWDLLLSHPDGRQMVVEVKGATLIKDGDGYFPDAVTKRGAKHVRELGEIAKEPHWEAALLFVAQRDDIKSIKPADHIDPDFGKAMREAEKAGVKLLGCRCHVGLEGIKVIGEIDVSV
ncbi:DNA/RNA nuclease SfsA [Evansella tamaricis]|uniref:Sugar fermentation stimulation protein homolog n=1 Tax=Evansella tamaricis TaxID=2069301 RepID=A0ABS6JHQ6_9BACI|nr:DNA/RNA nuclease SfsA [Evansella tamaricis]MBU9713166.1 DNA/RNA nuclease SfsA [Evansella tamaricis]